jgi:hypothetical protein
MGMNLEVARNIAIVVALALVVWLVPGGGEGADLVGQILGGVYRQFRGEIFGLGDQWRFALYAAIGVAVVTVAASTRLFATGAGTLLFFALIGAASYTVYLVWQKYRSYT